MLCALSLIFTMTCEEGISICILQKKILKLIEVKSFVHDHLPSKWQQ